jgi:hypothetical protein
VKTSRPPDAFGGSLHLSYLRKTTRLNADVLILLELEADEEEAAAALVTGSKGGLLVNLYSIM